MCEPAEEWRPVPDFEWFYEVSSLGRVRALEPRGTWGPGQVKVSGSLDRRVFLNAEGRVARPAVKLLVAAAFLGWKPGQRVVMRDGNPQNLRADNLLVMGEPTAERRQRLAEARAAQAKRTMEEHEARHAGAAEEWRAVPGVEGYEVSALGCVRNIWTGHLLKGRNNKGHPAVEVRSQGGLLRRQVSHLVCLAFVGPAPSPNHRPRHLDGDRMNNRPSNLVWYRGRPKSLGLANTDGGHKLDWNDVLQIRELAPSMSRQRLADRFGVSKRLVVQIVLGQRWKAPKRVTP